MAKLDSPPDHQESDLIMWNLGIPIGFLDIAFCCTLMSNPIPCLASKELAFWPPRVPHWGPSIRSQGTSAQCFIFRSAGRCFSISCRSHHQSPNQKKSRKTGKSSVLLKRNFMESSGKFEITKKKYPQIWCQKFPFKKNLTKKSRRLPSTWWFHYGIRHLAKARCHGVMRGSSKISSLISKVSRIDWRIVKMSSEQRWLSEGRHERIQGRKSRSHQGDKKQVTLSWNSLVLSCQSINLASEPLHILSDISRYCDVPRAKMWRLIA